jgi:hypothetical protein
LTLYFSKLARAAVPLPAIISVHLPVNEVFLATVNASQ